MIPSIVIHATKPFINPKFSLVREYKKFKKHKVYLFTTSIASLICIVTDSLFSYPLQIFPIVFQAVVCLCIVSSFSSNSKLQIHLSEKTKRISTIAFALTGFFLAGQFYFNFQFSRKSQQAFELQRSGFNQKALKVYKELNESMIKDGNVLYLYARELYYTNQPRLAAQVLSDAKNYYCSNNVYKLSAQIEQELKHYSQAEEDYQTAVYMVPNRMISRYDLLHYYVEKKDTANISYWSNSILDMPVKVPSPITMNIKKKAEAILLQIGHKK